jgi:hypothetical protein
MAKPSKPESPEFMARRRRAIVELARKRRQKELVRAATAAMNRSAKLRVLLPGSAAPQS